jgi:hypothetical protein
VGSGLKYISRPRPLNELRANTLAPGSGDRL